MSQSQDDLNDILNELYRITAMHDQLQWWIVDARKRFKDLPEIQRDLDESQARLDEEVRRVSLSKERIRRRLAR